MSLRLYMDENVNGQIVDGLRRRGVDLVTVVEDGREGLPDPQVLDRAMELGRLLLSQDTDLLIEAKARQERSQSFVGVLYAHQLTPVAPVIDSLEVIAGACELAEVRNRGSIWLYNNERPGERER